MAWETRTRGGQYYTRSRKLNGRVVREYVGRGPLADQAAQADARERTERATAAASWRREREVAELASAQLRTLAALVVALTAEGLEAVGYHKTKGEWRRWRDS